MTPRVVEILYQMIAFLFAISVHESAHAWTASRCGDPTARMLGRVSLNPIRHIDLFGTIILPLVAAISGIPLLGWAKPTPVDPRNFRNPMLDDILTSVAGPVSNFIVATGALLLLGGIALSSASGHAVVMGLASGFGGSDSESALTPIAMLLFELMLINIVLAVFNLIPVPPLDGSHVLRHFLSDPVRAIYDRIGIFALLALVYLGGGLLSGLIRPFVRFYVAMLGKF
ncbi:MAG TPA: site-2 protease family protein [Terriglobales bacterium]|jgi:Zn-dependent protease|nr:site-2 protease family protein [Terriglobales bacterium]